MTQLTHENPSQPGEDGASGLHLSRRDFSMLTKPRIALMVLITAAMGYALAPGEVRSWTMIGLLSGVGLACMGASALNQYFERDPDARMRRTRTRPLPAGRLEPAMALLLGGLLSILGVSVLRVTTTPLAALLTALTVVLYVFVYTPLKRRTVWNTLIGAAPGALPPVIGYAAGAGRLAWAPAILFAIMVVWQLPHFYAIAWVYRDEYAAAGYRMLPTVGDGSQTFIHILVSSALLVPLGAAPWWIGMAGNVYLAVALLAGGMFFVLSAQLMRKRTRRAARIVFFYSLIYLPLVLAAMIFDGLLDAA